MPVCIPGLAAGSGRLAASERETLVKTLGEAIECYQRTCGSEDVRERLVHSVSEAWMLSDDRSSTLAFASICDQLEIDPAQVRRILSAWKAERVLK